VRELTKVFGENVLLFSVDYRLAEAGSYPKSLSDCWEAYLWLINVGSYYLGINNKMKIIVSGDSAGGNLSLSLCNLAIKECVRKPDGLFLNYPPLNLDRECFTSSMFFSFSDVMLPFTIIEQCRKSYAS
jgi:acetyl esterase/lipase